MPSSPYLTRPLNLPLNTLHPASAPCPSDYIACRPFYRPPPLPLTIYWFLQLHSSIRSFVLHSLNCSFIFHPVYFSIIKSCVFSGFIHFFMRPPTHACIHAPMHPCTHAFMQPCIHATMHSCNHAFMQPCIHATMHKLSL